MKYYAQFTQFQTTKWNQAECRYIPCTPYYQDILGSSGVCILDGRNSMNTMINDAKIQAQRLQPITPIHGIRIMRGNRFDNSQEVEFIIP